LLKELEDTGRTGKRRSCIEERGFGKTWIIFEVINYRNAIKRISNLEAFFGILNSVETSLCSETVELNFSSVNGIEIYL
jgi:hypothetical protein